MSGTATMTGCNGAHYESSTPAADPFYSIRYHFGMLLGVEDFETEQAYHRGKHRLHNAWLHGEGVVWGLEVNAPANDDDVLRGEIEVLPGLALDAAGNELHVDTALCVSVSQWYEARKAEKLYSEDNESTQGDGSVVAEIDAHVVARFRSCLMRPVPAMMEPCVGSGADTAYSRAYETVELLLRPGLPQDPSPLPYHRLRLLFGLEAAQTDDAGQPTDADQKVLDAIDAIATAAEADRAALALDAFRKFAALDVIDLQPLATAAGAPSTRYPVPDDQPPVLLATLTGIRLVRRSADGDWELEAAPIDNTVRRSHVATSTIQELLTGIAGGIAGSAPASLGGPRDGSATRAGAMPAEIADAGGPRVDPETIHLSGRNLSFSFSAPVNKSSIADMESVDVRSFTRTKGWVHQAVKGVEMDRGRTRAVLKLADDPAGEVVRITLRGTGETPILGADFVPFAGAVGGTPGTQHQGNDLTYMLATRS